MLFASTEKPFHCVNTRLQFQTQTAAFKTGKSRACQVKHLSATVLHLIGASSLHSTALVPWCRHHANLKGGCFTSLVFQIRECLQLLSRPYLVTLQHKTDAVYGHSEAQQTGKDMQSSLGIFKVNPKRLTTALYVRLKGIIQILTYMTSSSGLHHPS